MPTITGSIHDLLGRPANGTVRFRACRRLQVGAVQVSRTAEAAVVRQGRPEGEGNWRIPPTPPHVSLELEQDFEGDELVRFTLVVPNVPTLTYRELIAHRRAPERPADYLGGDDAARGGEGTAG